MLQYLFCAGNKVEPANMNNIAQISHRCNLIRIETLVYIHLRYTFTRTLKTPDTAIYTEYIVLLNSSDVRIPARDK